MLTAPKRTMCSGLLAGGRCQLCPGSRTGRDTETQLYSLSISLVGFSPRRSRYLPMSNDVKMSVHAAFNGQHNGQREVLMRSALVSLCRRRRESYHALASPLTAGPPSGGKPTEAQGGLRKFSYPARTSSDRVEGDATPSSQPHHCRLTNRPSQCKPTQACPI